MDNPNRKRNVALALFILAALVLAGTVLNCFANENFGQLTREVLGSDADLGGMKLSVMTAGGVAAVLMVLTGWQTWKGRRPQMNFILALATTLLLTVLTVFSRQQGGNFLSQAANTVSMVCSFLAVAIANRERR